MVKGQTFSIKAKDYTAKVLIEKAKAYIVGVRVKAQEQKTLASQAAPKG